MTKPSPLSTKAALRKELLHTCATRSPQWLAEASEKITAALEQSEPFLRADTVALYWALGGEVATQRLLEKWHTHKTILLPVIAGDHLILRPYTGQSCLAEACYGIHEPQGEPSSEPSARPEAIDLIVVPGVGFDRRGHRLGRGKGFYDRLLATTRATKIGICFDFQLLGVIPAEPHDVAMDMILSGSDAGAELFRIAPES